MKHLIAITSAFLEKSRYFFGLDSCWIMFHLCMNFEIKSNKSKPLRYRLQIWTSCKKFVRNCTVVQSFISQVLTLNIDLILWHTQLMLNHGLNHGLFLSLFKLIPCPIRWILYVLVYLDFILKFQSSFSITGVLA